MLIEFRVANYISIGEEQVLSLVPAPKQKEHYENIIQRGKHQALNAVAIYGANASGKSNLLKAMGILGKLINFSARFSSTTKLPYDPFLLREDWINKPTFLEIVFLIAEDRYRYGIEFNQNEIVSEWLFRKSIGREVKLFQRSQDIIDVSSGLKASSTIIDAAIEATRDNGLFLSTCDILNIEEAKNILHWFKKYTIIDGLNTDHEAIKTISLWENQEYHQKIKEY
ncbi:AAA family ATPase, partial [Planktothrix agardhii]|uniref:AAA family ATPase n=1 Tax=Planktothrix agardhii TaxID=1160 RepID=UPI00333F05A6